MSGTQTMWQTNPRQGSCLARSPSTCLRCLLFSSLSSKANRLRTWLTRATCEIGASSLYHSKLKSDRKIHRFLIRERRGRLDLFALNVPTDFLFRNFVSLKENAFALCSQVARTIKQGFALQSSRLFYSQFSTKK